MAAALEDFGDVDVLRAPITAPAQSSLPVTTAAAAPAAPSPVLTTATRSPIPSRNRKKARRRPIGVPAASSSSLPSISAPPAPTTGMGMAAPWEVNEQVEAAEKKQELREALRKKLKQQKMSRSNRTALEAKEERDSAAAAGGGGIGGGGSAADLSSAMENLDSSMLQALAARMGVAPDKMPNKRKIERMLKGMSVTEMMARAKGRTGK